MPDARKAVLVDDLAQLKAKQASQKIGLRKLAAQANIDPANLYNTFAGKDAPARKCLLIYKALMHSEKAKAQI